MPYRALNGLLVAAGLVAALVLMVLGADLALAARTGPRWKRRLVAAGLGLLAALGWTPGGCNESAPPAPTNGGAGTATITVSPVPAATPAGGQGLTETPQWTHLTATWKKAEEVASGRRGPYPFDEAGKKKLLADLATVGAEIEALAKASLLNEAETGLLREDLKRLVAGVEAHRPTERVNFTCYEPMMMQPSHDSLARLEARLPLLEKLAAAEKIHPDAVRKVLATIEEDIAFLEVKDHLNEFEPKQRPAAEKVRDAARAALDRVKTRLDGSAQTPPRPATPDNLASNKNWAIVLQYWQTVTPLAESGQSTEKQREDAEKYYTAATAALKRLSDAGELTEGEAGLVLTQARCLREDMLRNPPTDSNVTCYVMAIFPPQQQSLDRLSARLPMLKKMLEAGKLHPAVIEKILPPIEADLKQLGSLPADYPANMREAFDKQAAAVRAEVERAVADLKKAAEAK